MSKEPIVANIIAMSVPAIAIIWMLLRHQDKKMKIQVEDNKNIRNFDYKLAKLKNKHKGKGGRDE